MAQKLLIVEDDPMMQHYYRAFFRRQPKTEFACHLEPTGGGALEHLEKSSVDVVVLDWVLPDMTGLRVLKGLRASRLNKHAAVLMVTARTAVDQKVLALESGADDYLTKPFEGDELAARLRSLVRRKTFALEDSKVLEVEGLKLEPATGHLTVDGAPVHLHPKELKLLKFFLEHPNMLHSADRLAEAVWGEPCRSLQFHISTLRKKLGPAWEKRLETHRGGGYLLNTYPILP